MTVQKIDGNYHSNGCVWQPKTTAGHGASALHAMLGTNLIGDMYCKKGDEPKLNLSDLSAKAKGSFMRRLRAKFNKENGFKDHPVLRKAYLNRIRELYKLPSKPSFKTIYLINF